ncbi:MAG: DUF805 domain-containing protein [Bacteroidia bacterium]|nr:DUF805 domain-containing protein [Bacteroidia bacterium]
MLKRSFSFNGRARKKEYFLSVVIFLVLVYGGSYFIDVITNSITGKNFSEKSSAMEWLEVLILIIAYWFMLSQSTRRCHDIGRSGWWCLLPFYWLVLIRHPSSPEGEDYQSIKRRNAMTDIIDSE